MTESNQEEQLLAQECPLTTGEKYKQLLSSSPNKNAFTGSSSKDFNDNLIAQMCLSLNLYDIQSEEITIKINGMMDAVKSINPKDELEGMLITQLVAAHNATMECYHKAINPGYTFEQQQQSLGFANKLTRSYVTLVEGLQRYRCIPQNDPKVTVQNVQVNDGGQAILSNIHKS